MLWSMNGWVVKHVVEKLTGPVDEHHHIFLSRTHKLANQIHPNGTSIQNIEDWLTNQTKISSTINK